MNKFKIEKGISRINRVKLQATIEESIAADLALLGEWSNNDKNYIVNELLRFALSQDSEFQAYKESVGTSRPEPRASGTTHLRAATSSIGGQGRAKHDRVWLWSSDIAEGTVVSRLKTLCRILVRHRFLLSAGLSAAAGIILKSIVLIPVADPLFRYAALQRPSIYVRICMELRHFSIHNTIPDALDVLLASVHPFL